MQPAIELFTNFFSDPLSLLRAQILSMQIDFFLLFGWRKISDVTSGLKNPDAHLQCP